MPTNQIFTPYTNINMLTLVWNNSSEKTIYDLTILINIFGSDLNEITQKKVENKYYFNISGNSTFNYSFEPIVEQFFLRVRFKGKFNSWFPFMKFKFNQNIWYSFKTILDPNSKKTIGYDTYNTFTEDIRSLQTKYKATLNEYEKIIDKKRW